MWKSEFGFRTAPRLLSMGATHYLKTILCKYENLSLLTGSNFEHIQTSHLGPNLNFEPLKHHQNWNLLKKNGPNFFQNHKNQTSNMSEHVILAKNRTSNLPNITKNRTVREHRTVRSTSSNNIIFANILGINT